MSATLGAAVAFSLYFPGGGLIRWFADLPIERKLRIVIGAPAIAAFTLAVIVPMVTNLMHSRAELRRFATRVAGVTGVNVIEALEAGDDKSAVKALQGAARGAGGGQRADRAARRPHPRHLHPRTRRCGGDRAGSALQDLAVREASAARDVRPRRTPGIRAAKWSCEDQGRRRCRRQGPRHGADHRAARRRLSRLARFHAHDDRRPGRGAGRRLLGRGSAAASNIRAHRESCADDEARVDRRGLHPAGRGQRAGRDRLADRGLQPDAQPDSPARLAARALSAIPRAAGLGAHDQSRQRQPRAQAGDRRRNGGQGGGGTGEQREERVSRAHEPRDPYADERRDGNVRAAAGYRALRAAAAPGGDHHAAPPRVCSQIINDILDFSKIEAGKLELEHIEFALREIIEETIEILVLRARAKGLELRCEIERTVPAAGARRSGAAAASAHQSGGKCHQVHRDRRGRGARRRAGRGRRVAFRGAATPASASPPRRKLRSSAPSRRPTPSPRASTAARVLGSPFAAS